MPDRPATLAIVMLALFTAGPAHSGPMEDHLRRASASIQQNLIPEDAQGRISASVGRNDPAYHARALSKGRAELTGPRHDFVADVTAAGVEVRTGKLHWQLALRQWGRGSRMLDVPKGQIAADANHVELSHGNITEWYVNGPLGLEQGFTIAAPPPGARGPLDIELASRGGVTLPNAHGAKGIEVVAADRSSRLRYSRLAASDARGRTLPVKVCASGSVLRIRVDDRGARYPIVIDPLVELAKLVPAKPTEGQFFGLSIAIDGDTVAVGSPDANGGRGAVYVFVRTAPSWTSMTEVAELTQSMPTVKVGESVAISGDAIVTGYGAAALVFVRPPGGWVSGTETAVLTASDVDTSPGSTDIDFGYGVAIDGDTIVAGAPFYGTYRGAAYVYVKPPGGWATATETAKLTSDAPVINDELGFSVAIQGDTIVAGAPLGFPVAVPGKVLVFTRPLGGWASETETATLTPSDGAGDDRFGNAVALDGNAIVVGAPDHDVGALTGVGGVYVFVNAGGGWVSATETAMFQASNVQMDSGLGMSVAVAGDRVVAGAGGFELEAGAVFVFDKPVSGWVSGTETTMLQATDPTSGDLSVEGDFFGNAVSIDAGGTIVTTAPNDDLPRIAFPGAAYAFEDLPGALTCPPAPSTTCASAPKGSLALSYNGLDTFKDKLVWKFKHGPSLHAADFGDPLGATNYALCVYGDGALELSAHVVPGLSRWALAGDGYAYKDPSKVSFVEGIQKIQLKGGSAGSSTISMKAKGDDLAQPRTWDFGFGSKVLNATTDVVVQLQQDGGGCYETAFTAAQVAANSVTMGKGKLKAKK